MSRALLNLPFVCRRARGRCRGAEAGTLSLVGTSAKVCQLTGETDWATTRRLPHDNVNFGMTGPISAFPSKAEARSLSVRRYLPINHPRQHSVGAPDDALG